MELLTRSISMNLTLKAIPFTFKKNWLKGNEWIARIWSNCLFNGFENRMRAHEMDKRTISL